MKARASISNSSLGARMSSRAGSPGEFEFIASIRKRAREQAGGPVLGIGDDCAILKQVSGRETVITADLLVEDIDFRLEYTPPHLLGHKALAVSLSDVAAMGARPRWAMISVGLPGGLWRTKFLDRFYEGFFELANRFGVSLIGGDISRTPNRIVIDSVVIGESEARASIRRTGARPGDKIFVTGELGGAAGGLSLLDEGARLPKSKKRSKQGQIRDSLLLRQIAPQPRTRVGMYLGRRGFVTSMIDISDGLSSDLMHICRSSGVGAIVAREKVPIDSALVLASHDVDEQFEMAINGGEDFELLFTVRTEGAARLKKSVEGVSLTEIGVITENESEIILQEGDGTLRRIQSRGFEHFASSGRKTMSALD